MAAQSLEDVSKNRVKCNSIKAEQSMEDTVSKNKVK